MSKKRANTVSIRLTLEELERLLSALNDQDAAGASDSGREKIVNGIRALKVGPVADCQNLGPEKWCWEGGWHCDYEFEETKCPKFKMFDMTETYNEVEKS